MSPNCRCLTSDLRPCRFFGAHGLESLTIEPSCHWPHTPPTRRYIHRETIAEEHHYRGLRLGRALHASPALASGQGRRRAAAAAADRRVVPGAAQGPRGRQGRGGRGRPVLRRDGDASPRRIRRHRTRTDASARRSRDPPRLLAALRIRTASDTRAGVARGHAAHMRRAPAMVRLPRSAQLWPIAAPRSSRSSPSARAKRYVSRLARPACSSNTCLIASLGVTAWPSSIAWMRFLRPSSR